MAAKVRVKYEQSSKMKNTQIKVICFLCQTTQAANIALAANQNWGQKK